jgi:hypothetical protein
MGERIAKMAAVKFLSGRPYLADKNGVTIDKQVYFKALTEVFAAFPEWVGVNVTAAGSDFRRSHATWLPTSDELFEALTKEAGKDRIAAHTAGLHKKEAERRRIEDGAELPPEKRAELANKFAGLAAKLKSTPIVEPVAGKEPVDHDAIERRRKVLAEIESRKTSRTPEDLAEDERVRQVLLDRRTA